METPLCPRSPKHGKCWHGAARWRSLGPVLRIAHVSDLHVLSPHGVEWRQMLFNKRLTGYANLVRQRGRVYRRAYLAAVLAAAAARADHLVVTGDITNLSLEREFEEARALLDGAARTVEVTVVPGNHDVYLPHIHEARRFAHHFGPFLRSDLPALACALRAGPFPCVKLRGPAAIIALSSAVPRPPFIASDLVGDAELAALEAVLAHPEVARRTPVVLIHHPPVDDRLRLLQLRDGLVDAARLCRVLAPLARGLVLFGHLHLRVRRRLRTDAGWLDAIGASGAALDHPAPAVRAGFNAYTIADDGSLASAEAHVLSPDGRTFERMPLRASPSGA
ncbi:MAG: metallophosphoesterase family protein [Polyangiaceae bacterium]|nr:metallophosphoesterase family protein [Polyangiaceae bacterium]